MLEDELPDSMLLDDREKASKWEQIHETLRWHMEGGYPQTGKPQMEYEARDMSGTPCLIPIELYSSREQEILALVARAKEGIRHGETLHDAIERLRRAQDTPA